MVPSSSAHQIAAKKLSKKQTCKMVWEPKCHIYFRCATRGNPWHDWVLPDFESSTRIADDSWTIRGGGAYRDSNYHNVRDNPLRHPNRTQPTNPIHKRRLGQLAANNAQRICSRINALPLIHVFIPASILSRPSTWTSTVLCPWPDSSSIGDYGNNRSLHRIVGCGTDQGCDESHIVQFLP